MSGRREERRRGAPLAIYKRVKPDLRDAALSILFCAFLAFASMPLYALYLFIFILDNS